MKVVILIALFTVLFCCTSRQQTKAEMRAILHERNEKLGELFKAGDAAALALMYDDSAKLCPNGADIQIGREAIRKFWQHALEGTQLLDMQTETLTVDGDDQLIYETGRTTTRTRINDSVYVSRVKFANVWRRQPDGTFLLDVDIWNSRE